MLQHTLGVIACGVTPILRVLRVNLVLLYNLHVEVDFRATLTGSHLLMIYCNKIIAIQFPNLCPYVILLL